MKRRIAVFILNVNTESLKKFLSNNCFRWCEGLVILQDPSTSTRAISPSEAAIQMLALSLCSTPILKDLTRFESVRKVVETEKCNHVATLFIYGSLYHVI
jgi:hypothetical protein